MARQYLAPVLIEHGSVASITAATGSLLETDTFYAHQDTNQQTHPSIGSEDSCEIIQSGVPNQNCPF